VVAAALGPLRPLSFISNGAYDETAGVVAKTMGNIAGAAFDPTMHDSNGKHFHSPSTMAKIAGMQEKRLAALKASETLPALKKAVSSLYAARLAAPELKKLKEALPSSLSDEKMKRQAQLAFAAYRAGLAVSATIVADVNVDTHTNHDVVHVEGLQSALMGLDSVLEEAEALGIADSVVVAVGSDFGRGPFYNQQNGKDHYSITSMMLMGPGIPGNRVVGATDEELRPKPVSPSTLKEVASGGVRITPAHVHRALRGLSGVLGTGVDKEWPVYAPEDLPLFV
jgi:uncharacterized protein (DUF1501 family)